MKNTLHYSIINQLINSCKQCKIKATMVNLNTSKHLKNYVKVFQYLAVYLIKSKITYHCSESTSKVKLCQVTLQKHD